MIGVLLLVLHALCARSEDIARCPPRCKPSTPFQPQKTSVPAPSSGGKGKKAAQVAAAAPPAEEADAAEASAGPPQPGSPRRLTRRRAKDAT